MPEEGPPLDRGEEDLRRRGDAREAPRGLGGETLGERTLPAGAAEPPAALEPSEAGRGSRAAGWRPRAGEDEEPDDRVDMRCDRRGGEASGEEQYAKTLAAARGTASGEEERLRRSIAGCDEDLAGAWRTNGGRGGGRRGQRGERRGSEKMTQSGEGLH